MPWGYEKRDNSDEAVVLDTVQNVDTTHLSESCPHNDPVLRVPYVSSNADAFPDSALKLDTGLHTQSVTERTYR